MTAGTLSCINKTARARRWLEGVGECAALPGRGGRRAAHLPAWLSRGQWGLCSDLSTCLQSGAPQRYLCTSEFLAHSCPPQGLLDVIKFTHMHAHTHTRAEGHMHIDAHPHSVENLKTNNNVLQVWPPLGDTVHVNFAFQCLKLYSCMPVLKHLFKVVVLL